MVGEQIYDSRSNQGQGIFWKNSDSGLLQIQDNSSKKLFHQALLPHSFLEQMATLLPHRPSLLAVVVIFKPEQCIKTMAINTHDTVSLHS